MTKCLAIVTRTQNRAAGLMRCYETLMEQSTKRAFEWIIVNDGGELVDERAFENNNFSVVVINNDQRKGRSRAANQGFAAATSRYGCLLDDDDTLSTNFIEEMLNFLDESASRKAVACHSLQVIEEVQNDVFTERERYPSPFNCEALTLGKMTAFNRVDSNAVMFEIDIFNTVGGFDETLDLMEDYDLFLRMLMVIDIDVLAKPLALHHVRPLAENSYQNTVVALKNQHQLADARYRNKKFREDVAAGNIGLGYLLQIAQTQAEIELFRKEWRNAMQALVSHLNPKHWFKKLSKQKTKGNL